MDGRKVMEIEQNSFQNSSVSFLFFSSRVETPTLGHNFRPRPNVISSLYEEIIRIRNDLYLRLEEK